ncbi:hypothetical protein CLF_102396 [Clonorchis sinensis]|uniref:Uncharacterized protein n=1 Tax=Clonorchis sinensis TaxID=79923 RepID=G7Y7U3_CLOSI|nr:hypothetical protein CLF_102396 [Clonorchis sinensis]
MPGQHRLLIYGEVCVITACFIGFLHEGFPNSSRSFSTEELPFARMRIQPSWAYVSKKINTGAVAVYDPKLRNFSKLIGCKLPRIRGRISVPHYRVLFDHTTCVIEFTCTGLLGAHYHTLGKCRMGAKGRCFSRKWQSKQKDMKLQCHPKEAQGLPSCPKVPNKRHIPDESNPDPLLNEELHRNENNSSPERMQFILWKHYLFFREDNRAEKVSLVTKFIYQPKLLLHKLITYGVSGFCTHFDCSRLGLGNLAVPQPVCFFRVSWQLCIEKALQLNDNRSYVVTLQLPCKSHDTRTTCATNCLQLPTRSSAANTKEKPPTNTVISVAIETSNPSMFVASGTYPRLLHLHATFKTRLDRHLQSVRFFRNTYRKGLGNLAVSQPSCFLRVAWQLGTERVLQPNECKKMYIIIKDSNISVDTDASLPYKKMDDDAEYEIHALDFHASSVSEGRREDCSTECLRVRMISIRLAHNCNIIVL